MSLCDSCYAPGQCCKNIRFFAGGEVSFRIDEDLKAQLLNHRPEEDKEAGRKMPFVPVIETSRSTDPESGREYASYVFRCSNLTTEGRCGDYENRPQLCRVFEPGSDLPCVHYRGAEGGESGNLEFIGAVVEAAD